MLIVIAWYGRDAMVGTSSSPTYMCVNHLVSLLHVFVNPAAAMASVPPPGGFNSSCAASLALTTATDNVSVSLAVFITLVFICHLLLLIM